MSIESTMSCLDLARRRGNLKEDAVAFTGGRNCKALARESLVFVRVEVAILSHSVTVERAPRESESHPRKSHSKQQAQLTSTENTGDMEKRTCNWSSENNLYRAGKSVKKGKHFSRTRRRRAVDTSSSARMHLVDALALHLHQMIWRRDHHRTEVQAGRVDLLTCPRMR